MQLTIPEHAFDYLGLKEKSYAGTDLLTDESLTLEIRRNQQIGIDLKPNSGAIFKLQ
jgi:hypothetical protein